VPESRAPFIDPDHTDHRDRTITARWNQGPLNAEGWQRQSLLTVQHFVRRGYRATVSVSAVRRGDGFTEEDLGPPSLLLFWTFRPQPGSVPGS
jgi:hypothetical protein